VLGVSAKGSSTDICEKGDEQGECIREPFSTGIEIKDPVGED
jgi:hypothetical protein